MPKKKIQKLIVWIRRELRVDDRLGLWSAVQGAGEVIPLYYSWFRMLNPILQTKRFDSRCEDLRKYVPDKYIQEPWLMPVSV